MSEPADIIPRDERAPAPRRRHLSVAGKLTLLVGLALAILLAVLLTGSWFYWEAVLQRQVNARLDVIADSRRDMIDSQVALLLQRAELMTDRGELRGFLYEQEVDRPPTTNRQSSQESLQRMANRKPVLSVSLADNSGTVLLSSEPGDVGRNVAHEPEFEPGRQGPYLGLPNRMEGRFQARLAAPVRTRSEPNRIYGVLLATVDLTPMVDALENTDGLGKTGETLLGVREGNQLRFLFPPRNAPQATTVPLTAASALRTAVGGGEDFAWDRDYRGIPVLAAARPIHYGGWGLVVKMDAREAYAPVGDAVLLGAILGGLVGLAGVAAAYAVARTFTQPLRRLATAAARVAAGHHDPPVPVESDDEFGHLSASFNAMTADLGAQRLERDRAEQALREADRRKDEFLAMLGHELRNPLSAISHAVRLWKNAADDPQVGSLAREVIERQTDNLNRHVEDLLDVVRVSEGKIELRRQPVDLGATITHAVETARRLFDEKGQHLELSLAEPGRWHLDADPTRIEQIVANLLTNASKYTPEGGHISVTERYAGGEALITVHDDGIGIAPDLIPVIFELFTQGDSPLHRASAGLGIGLNLCRKLVELHGGSVAAHSAGPGQGAEFTVRLPARSGPAPIAAPAGDSPAPTPSERRRILLVDDNEDTSRLLSRLLTRRGHEVTTASDGLAALAIAHEIRPDVMLLDIGLPGLDGYALARRLRAEGFAGTPLIAISGYAQDDDQARAFDAGFDHHLSKPIDFDALSALLVTAPGRRGTPSNGAS